MSASCQFVNSMFEVRPIGTRTKFKPVKKPKAEIPSVELVAELISEEAGGRKRHRQVVQRENCHIQPGTSGSRHSPAQLYQRGYPE